MKKGFFLGILISIVFKTTAFAAEMKAINFTQKGEVSELEFLFDENDIQASKFQVKEDKQIIVDLTGVQATDRVMRAFDTSEFSGGVVFVKAYKKPKSDKDIRVAIQLRDNVRSVLVRKPNRVILQIENRYGVFSQKKVESNQSFKEKVGDVPSSQLAKLNIPKSDSIEDILDNVLMAGRKKYIGRKVTMNLKSVKPDEILKMIAETSGFNIITTEEVKKLDPISLNLNDVPWDQALDTVLEMNRLYAKKNGIILLVTSLDAATKERENEKRAKDAMIEQEPLLTKVFPISFAKIDDLKAILSEYSSEAATSSTVSSGTGSSGATTSSGTGVAPKRGKISIDTRTNSLIVKDTAEVIERMKKIVELLDTQTPQVLIESKIVEVSERYAKEIGLDQGLNFGYDPFSASLNNPSTGTNAGTFSFSSGPDTGRSIFGVAITRFNKLINLDFQLKLMESESKGKIISSPKVITKNNVEATISQTETSYYKVSTTTSSSGGNTTTDDWKAQDSSLELLVTPKITNEGTISMTVSVKKDSLGSQASTSVPADLTKRQIKTEVLVDNGATVVIGGIYSFQHTENHSGVPFLKDVPLVGWLFRTKYNPVTQKKELIIFLTPRVINQEEAGLVDRG